MSVKDLWSLTNNRDLNEITNKLSDIVPKYFTQVTEPTAEESVDGDIWIQIV